MAMLFSLHYLVSKEAELYAHQSLKILNAEKLNIDDLKMLSNNRLHNIAKRKINLILIYCMMGKYDKDLLQTAKEVEYILDNFPACSNMILKILINRGIGKILIYQGELKEAEKRLTESLQISEKVVGQAYSLATKAFRIEARIKLNRLNDSYEDCLSIFSMEMKKKNNYLILIYLTTYYHAAIIKYKQGDFKKATEHFSDFFNQMREFCKGFLKEKEYKELESKGVFAEINFSKTPSKEDCKQYLKRSVQIFSSVYSPDHPFVTDYVKKN